MQINIDGESLKRIIRNTFLDLVVINVLDVTDEIKLVKIKKIIGKLGLTIISLGVGISKDDLEMAREEFKEMSLELTTDIRDLIHKVG